VTKPIEQRRRGNPSSILYWADLRDDPKLRRCSPGAKGIWAVHMLPAAAESPEYGVVLLDGLPSLQAELGALFAREIGETVETTQALIDELVNNGAASVDERGRVYCRRMVREAKLRQQRSAAGKLGAAAKWQTDGKPPSAKSAGGSASNGISPTNGGWQMADEHHGEPYGERDGEPYGERHDERDGESDGKTPSAGSAESAARTTLNGDGTAKRRWQTNGDAIGKALPSSHPSHPSQFLTGAVAPPDADVDLDPVKVIFGQGLSWLVKTTGKTNDACRSILGSWRKQFNDDAELIAAIGRAVRAGVQHPESWMQAVIKSRKPKASPRAPWAEYLP